MTERAEGHTRATPFDDPWGSLTPGARKIVAAASQLLGKEGYDALTYERIAQLAGVNKSTIRYNFGSKSAVVAAVVDAMVHDGCNQLVDSLADVGIEERVKGTVSGIGQMIEETEAFRGYFDILPHALREPELRDRILGLYRWWYVVNQEWLGLVGETSSADARLRLGVGQIIVALIDGLSIQAALDPGGHDLGPAFDALALMLSSSLTKLLGDANPEDLNENAGQSPH